ncbi:MAG: hypothetical protein ACKV19_06390 [Verrucomicrobiales bacterium]
MRSATLKAIANIASFYNETGRVSEAIKRQEEVLAQRKLSRLRQKLKPLLPVVATLIPPDSEWKWFHPTDGVDSAADDADFHATFFAADYDDSTWKTGQDNADPSGGFGCGRDFAGVDIGMPEDETHRHSA